MTLLETTRLIEKIANEEPNINSIVKSGDIYDLNKEEYEQKYSAFCLTQRNHTYKDQFTTFNYVMYYVDRLMLDESNALEIQSTACNVLNNIINKLELEDVVDVTYGDITTFTSKFTSLCAGAYIYIGVTVANYLCVDGEEEDKPEPGPEMIEIEYLQHDPDTIDDTCWINLEYVPTGQDINIYHKFMLLGYPTNQTYRVVTYLANSDTVNGNTYGVIKNDSKNDQIYICNGNLNTTGTTKTITIGEPHVLNCIGLTYELDGVKGNLSTRIGTTGNTKGIVFWGHSGGDPAAYSRIYYFKLEKAGELIFDLIPVRIGDEGYFYNKVDGRLYGNQGTGKLKLGPDIKKI